jgi:hypothetical protein
MFSAFSPPWRRAFFMSRSFLLPWRRENQREFVVRSVETRLNWNGVFAKAELRTLTCALTWESGMLPRDRDVPDRSTWKYTGT